jgi:hypothetical protein
MIMAEAPPLIPDDTDDLRAWLVEHGVDRRRGDGTLRAGYQSLHDAITAGETAISGRSHRQAITGAQDDLDAMHPRWGQRFEVVAAHGEEPAKLRYKPPGT